MTRVYYKEAVGAFIVFDVTRMDTFKAIDKWKADLDTKVLLPDGRPIPCVLIGNKADIQPADPMFLNTETMERLSKEKGFAGWFLTSAKDNTNVEESAEFLVQKIIDNDKWSRHQLNKDQTDSIDLMAYNPNMNLNSNKKCNC